MVPDANDASKNEFQFQLDSNSSFPVIHRDTSSVTLLLNPQFFERNQLYGTNPNDWDSNIIHVVYPEIYPNVRLFISSATKSNVYNQVVAAQFQISHYDVVTATKLLRSCLPEWRDELALRSPMHSSIHNRKMWKLSQKTSLPVNQLSQYQLMSIEDDSLSKNAKLNRPTLFSLLARLGDFCITTVEQRNAIRRIVTDYLNNDISHGKVFTYLGQVVGYQTLENIIRSLSQNPIATQQQFQTSTQIQTNFNLNKPMKPIIRNTSFSDTVINSDVTKKNPFQSYVGSSNANVRPIKLYEDYDETNINTSLINIQYIIKYVPKSLRWMRMPHLMSSFNISYGESLILLDNKAFILGGLPQKKSNDLILRKHEYPNSTFQTIRALRLVDFSVEMINTKGFDSCPPSLIYHNSQLCSLLSGPMMIVHGGILPPASWRKFDSHFDNYIRSLKESSSYKEETLHFNNYLYGLDIFSKRWIIIDRNSPERPPCRHSHTSVVISSTKSDMDIHSHSYSEWLLIFGGIGVPESVTSLNCDNKNQKLLNQTGSDFSDKVQYMVPCNVSDLVILNDLWIFCFVTGLWAKIETVNCDIPLPRFGMSSVWLTENSVFIFGGEGNGLLDNELNSLQNDNSNKTIYGYPPYSQRSLHSDAWILKWNSIDYENIDISNLNSFFHWIPFSYDSFIPRAHYCAVGLTLELSLDKSNRFCDSINSNLLWTENLPVDEPNLDNKNCCSYRVLFFIGGTVCNADGFIFETSSVMIGFVLTNSNFFSDKDNNIVPPDIIWRTINLIPLIPGQLSRSFSARRSHSCLFFNALSQSLDVSQSEKLKRYKMDLNDTHRSPLSLESITSYNDADFSEYIEFHRKTYTSISNQVPCILVYGGFSSTGACSTEPWVLIMSNFLPDFVKQVGMSSIERNLLTVSNLSGVRLTPNISHLLSSFGFYDSSFLCDLNPPKLSNIESIHSSEFNTLSVDDLDLLKQIWNDASQNYQPYLYQAGITLSSNLLWSLSSLVRHPFSPYAHLLNNSIKQHVKATQVHVSVKTVYGFEVIIVEDNGTGLSYKNLHLLLKSFGNTSEDLFRPSKLILKNSICIYLLDNSDFGLGFKIACSYLAYSCLVLTKTQLSLGLGLFSVSLNNLFGTSNFSCPIVCWSSLDGYPVCSALREEEFAQSLMLILNNSPLRSIDRVNHEFRSFKGSTGTRIIFFQLRKDIPHLVFTPDKRITYTSFKDYNEFRPPTMHSFPFNDIISSKKSSNECNVDHTIHLNTQFQDDKDQKDTSLKFDSVELHKFSDSLGKPVTVKSLSNLNDIQTTNEYPLNSSLLNSTDIIKKATENTVSAANSIAINETYYNDIENESGVISEFTNVKVNESATTKNVLKLSPDTNNNNNFYIGESEKKCVSLDPSESKDGTAFPIPCLSVKKEPDSVKYNSVNDLQEKTSFHISTGIPEPVKILDDISSEEKNLAYSRITATVFPSIGDDTNSITSNLSNPYHFKFERDRSDEQAQGDNQNPIRVGSNSIIHISEHEPMVDGNPNSSLENQCFDIKLEKDPMFINNSIDLQKTEPNTSVSCSIEKKEDDVSSQSIELQSLQRLTIPDFPAIPSSVIPNQMEINQFTQNLSVAGNKHLNINNTELDVAQENKYVANIKSLTDVLNINQLSENINTKESIVEANNYYIRNSENEYGPSAIELESNDLNPMNVGSLPVIPDNLNKEFRSSYINLEKSLHEPKQVVNHNKNINSSSNMKSAININVVNKQNHYSYSYGNENDSTSPVITNAFISSLQDKSIIKSVHDNFQSCVLLHNEFPLYTSAKDSIDFNLATYLYWSHLHSKADIYLNGTLLTPLVPNNSKLKQSDNESLLKVPKHISDGISDKYPNSLWRFVQKTLYHKLEFPYLFEPIYSQHNFYGIIGFLNNPNKTNEDNVDLVCETGRLINRGLCKLPLIPDWLDPAENKKKSSSQSVLTSLSFTALINVPNFIMPRATKEEFMMEGDLAYHDFLTKLEKVIEEYLSLCDNNVKLQQLQKRYIDEFYGFIENFTSREALESESRIEYNEDDITVFRDKIQDKSKEINQINMLNGFVGFESDDAVIKSDPDLLLCASSSRYNLTVNKNQHYSYNSKQKIESISDNDKWDQIEGIDDIKAFNRSKRKKGETKNNYPFKIDNKLTVDKIHVDETSVTDRNLRRHKRRVTDNNSKFFFESSDEPMEVNILTTAEILHDSHGDNKTDV